MSRCSWETDELARKMMEVIHKIHSEQRLEDDDTDKLFEDIKLGNVTGQSIKYTEDNVPQLTSESRRKYVTKSVSDFYDVAGRLFDLSLHSANIDWCLYRSGSQWAKFEVGDSRVSPIYLSTTTALDFAAGWKTGNVVFKILAPGITELLVIEDIFNPKKDVIDFENAPYEYEVTIPPGKMTIIEKNRISANGRDNIYVTVQFEQLTKEEAIDMLAKLK
jgi:hypothetical protein